MFLLVKQILKSHHNKIRTAQLVLISLTIFFFSDLLFMVIFFFIIPYLTCIMVMFGLSGIRWSCGYPHYNKKHKISFTVFVGPYDALTDNTQILKFMRWFLEKYILVLLSDHTFYLSLFIPHFLINFIIFSVSQLPMFHQSTNFWNCWSFQTTCCGEFMIWLCYLFVPLFSHESVYW